MYQFMTDPERREDLAKTYLPSNARKLKEAKKISGSYFSRK